MAKNIHEWVNTILIVVFGLLVLVGGQSTPVELETDGLGGGTRFPNGISADSTSPSSGEVRGTTLTVTNTSTLTGVVTASAGIAGPAKTATISATTTLTAADSGTTYFLSGNTGVTTITLPAVTATGTVFAFKVNGALDTGDVIVDSAEGDNIEGTLIVAGAVVDCDAEDQINFVTDGENLGDYFEIMSSGTQWLLGDSGALTAAKLTCTDPT